MSEVVAAGGGVLVAVAMWIFMFRLDRADIWPRTWVAAGALSLYAVGATAALGDAGSLVGPISPVEAIVGLAVGAVYLVATHVGAAVLSRIVPGFGRQLSDLYRLSDGDTAARMVGPLLAMAVAEELLFRGLIQGQIGLAVAVAAYGAVQLVERKWALIMAAVLGGTVWGALFEWRGGLVAPIVAHAVWTVTLTLAWPIHATTTTTTEQRLDA